MINTRRLNRKSLLGVLGVLTLTVAAHASEPTIVKIQLPASEPLRAAQLIEQSGIDVTILPSQLGEPDKQIYLSLTPDEQREVRDESREMFTEAVGAIGTDPGAGAYLVQGTEALYSPAPGETLAGVQKPKTHLSQASSKSKAFALTLWDAVVTSTIRTFNVYRGNLKGHAMGAKEIGLTFALKWESQVGVSRLRISQNIPVLLHIGYNRELKSIFIRYGFRNEHQAAEGSGLSFGGKLEAKFYAIKGSRPAGRNKFEGQAWYPPFPLPFGSIVADMGETYNSLGFAIGVNVADFIPFTSFMNTVNVFSETENAIRVPVTASSIRAARACPLVFSGSAVR